MSLHQDYIQKYGQKALEVYNQSYKPKHFPLKEIKQASHSRKKSADNLRSESNKHKASQSKLNSSNKNSYKNIKQSRTLKNGLAKLNLKSQHLKLGNPILSHRLNLVIPSPSMRQSPYISPYKNSLSRSKSSKRKTSGKCQTKRFEYQNKKVNTLQNTVNALKQQLKLNAKNRTKIQDSRGLNLSRSVSPDKSSVEISGILKDSIECLNGIQQIALQTQKIPEAVQVLKVALSKVLQKTKYFHLKWKQTQSQCNLYKKEVELMSNRIRQNSSRKNHNSSVQEINYNKCKNDMSNNGKSIYIKDKETSKYYGENEEVVLLRNQNRQYLLKIEQLFTQLQYYKSRQSQLFGMFNQFRTLQQEAHIKANYIATSHFLNENKTEKSSNADYQKQTRMKIVNQASKFGFGQQQNQWKVTSSYQKYPFQQRFTIGKQSQKQQLSQQYSQNQKQLKLN